MAVFDLVSTNRGCKKNETDWDEQRQVVWTVEGLSRAARGCLCLLQHDRGSQGLPSLVGASRWLLDFFSTGVTDAGGQVTLGRVDEERGLVPLGPRNPTCASVAARHPLWGSTLSTTALRTAGHLWRIRGHCQRLDGACRAWADCKLTASHPHSVSREALGFGVSSCFVPLG